MDSPVGLMCNCIQEVQDKREYFSYDKMSKTLICLTVSHNIYLKRDVRYRLFNGEAVKIVGVSVPVWFTAIGETTEPAEEVFCMYHLRLGADDYVEDTKDGYKIFISYGSADALKDITDGGSEELSISYKGKIRTNKRIYSSLHFINIKDISSIADTV